MGTTCVFSGSDMLCKMPRKENICLRFKKKKENSKTEKETKIILLLYSYSDNKNCG
jgi:hypothetical protein